MIAEWKTINGARVYIGEDGVPQYASMRGSGQIETKPETPQKRYGVIDTETEFFGSLGYTEDEEEELLEAMVCFTGEDFEDYRAKKDGGKTQDLIEKAIEKSSAKFNDDRIELYRGIRITKQNFSKIEETLQPGAIIDQNGLSSWSANPGIAASFAKTSNGKSIMFKDVTKGQRNALSISSVSNLPEEKEVVFSGKSQFKILSVSDQTYFDKYSGDEVSVYEVTVEEHRAS